jgi:hypothetical protein
VISVFLFQSSALALVVSMALAATKQPTVVNVLKRFIYFSSCGVCDSLCIRLASPRVEEGHSGVR